MLIKREESNTYLTHICGHHRSGEKHKEKIKYIELSANTVPFISYRCRLTYLLSDGTRGENGSKGEGGRVRPSNVDTGRLTLTSLFPPCANC